MRLRSTGLGKTELEGEVEGLEPAGDLLILHIKTTKPVRWHMRAGIQRKDVLNLIKSAFTFKMLKYLCGVGNMKNPKEPENF